MFPAHLPTGHVLCCGAQLLWRYNREAVALRIAFFMSAESGGVAHTVLVRDVPGLPYGTVAARIEDTALRFLPRFVKKRLVVCFSGIVVIFSKFLCELGYDAGC